LLLKKAGMIDYGRVPMAGTYCFEWRLEDKQYTYAGICLHLRSLGCKV
jgi:hypothetical protein